MGMDFERLETQEIRNKIREVNASRSLILKDFYEFVLPYNLSSALDHFREMNDVEMVQRIGDACFEEGLLCFSRSAYEFLKDREGIFKIILSKDVGSQELALISYLGETEEILYRNFATWATERSFPNAIPMEAAPIINMAYHLGNNYDMGIGVANGGCFSTYVFDSFGLETRLVEAHRKGRGATFNWATKTSEEDIVGKRIVVLDKDVVSGRTSRRVLRELQRLNPKSIDLVLNHNPTKGPYGLGTLLINVPQEYDNVFFPESFSYGEFDRAVEILEQSVLQ